MDEEDTKSINSDDEESLHEVGNGNAVGTSYQPASILTRSAPGPSVTHAPVEMAILPENHASGSDSRALQSNRERDFTTYPTEQTMVNKTVELEAHPTIRNRIPTAGLSLSRQASGLPRTQTMRSDRTKHTGLGGFPMPLEIIRSLAQKFAPEATKKLERTYSQAPVDAHNPPTALFTSFPLKVGRNSLFLDLTQEQKDELGGIEYRASKLLLKVVYSVSLSSKWARKMLTPQYIVLIPVISLIIVAPILSVNNPYAEFFESQHRKVAAPWFAMFSVWSSFTNCGLSLSDTSMIPFINSHGFVFSK